MLLALIIRLGGGFWSYRERLLRTRPGLLRRIRTVIYKRYLEQLGSYISLKAEFAGPPEFPHKPTGVFIAPGTRIGRGATVFQHVMLAKNGSETSRGFGVPTIGDDVYLGAGSKVIGSVTIGDRAKIGAGAIVVKDVPADAVAVSPAAVVLPAKTTDD